MIWFLVSAIAYTRVILFRRRFYLVFFFGIVFLSAFRYYVGSDFFNYANLYRYSQLGLDPIVQVEYSYLFISRFLGEMGFNFQAIIALYCILTYTFIYMGLKQISHDKEFLGVVIFFVYIVFYFPSLSIMRQSLAISIVFWGTYRFLHNEKYLKFLITVGVAYLFHISSLLYILCIPFYIFKLQRISYILGISLAAVLGMTFFGSIVEFFAKLFGISFKSYSFIPTPIPAPIFLINTGVMILGFIFVIINFKPKDHFLINIIFFMIVMRLLALDFIHITRFSAAFNIFIPIFLYHIVFSRLTGGLKYLLLILCAVVLTINDSFRAKKDYSYYQYSINMCVYGDPCPISIVGDVPLSDLLIREHKR